MNKTFATKRSRNVSEARAALQDLLSGAEVYQSKSADITEKFLKLKERFNLPNYEWAFLSGYMKAKTDEWYRTKLVYCLIWNGAPINMEWDKLTEEQKEFTRRNINVITGHFWRNADGTIGRVFFSSGN